MKLDVQFKLSGDPGWRRNPRWAAVVGQELSGRIDTLKDAIGSRKTATLIRRGLRKSQMQFYLAAQRVIQSKGLIDTGGMLRGGLRVSIPRVQKPGLPWAMTLIVGPEGYQSLFLEDGTKDRYTKKGHYRGRISNPKHMRLMQTVFRARRNSVMVVAIEEITAVLDKEIEKTVVRGRK